MPSKHVIIPLLLFLTLFSLTYASNEDISAMNDCNELNQITFLSNETLLTEFMEDNMFTLRLKVQPCIDLLVKNGKFASLNYYLNELSKRSIQFRESLQMSINDMKKELDEVNNKFRFDEADYNTILPAFQWAQSMNEIFIELKFAHRHDAPGCLEMKNIDIEIKEATLAFRGFCVLGDIPIKIEMRIDMWKEVDKELSTHGFGSVGRYQFTLKKKASGMYWDKLLMDGTSYPGNMRIWFEMKEKYEEQLKKYEEEDEEAQFKKEVEKIEQDALAKSAEMAKNKKNKKKKGGKKKKAGKEAKDANQTTTTTTTASTTTEEEEEKKGDL